METSKDNISLEDFDKVIKLAEFMIESSRRMNQATSDLLSFLEKKYYSKLD